MYNGKLSIKNLFVKLVRVINFVLSFTESALRPIQLISCNVPVSCVPSVCDRNQDDLRIVVKECIAKIEEEKNQKILFLEGFNDLSGVLFCLGEPAYCA